MTPIPRRMKIVNAGRNGKLLICILALFCALPLGAWLLAALTYQPRTIVYPQMLIKAAEYQCKDNGGLLMLSLQARENFYNLLCNDSAVFRGVEVRLRPKDLGKITSHSAP